MDKKTVIENGLLEQYLLGELDSDTTLQIEELIAKNTTIKVKYKLLEQDFETIGLENAIIPPEAIKRDLLSYIKSKKSKNLKVIKLNPFNSYTILAASIAAFFTLGAILMYIQLYSVKEQLHIVEQKNTELNFNLNTLSQSLENRNTLYETLINPDTKQYILNNKDALPKAKVISYVNHNTKSVVVNTERLPDLDDQHDYQMWADVEGKMINMGVLSKSKTLMAMTYIDDAESLNITIEPAGGSDHATVKNLVTNVYLE